jgi:hypothetical protein
MPSLVVWRTRYSCSNHLPTQKGQPGTGTRSRAPHCIVLVSRTFSAGHDIAQTITATAPTSAMHDRANRPRASR